MTTSRVPALTDALVTLFAATLPASTAVYDGPPTVEPNLGQEYVTVGASRFGDVGVTFQQVWATLGRQARDEALDLVCYLDVSSGDVDGATVKTTRDRAWTLFGLLETALRNDPTVGGVMPAGWADPASGTGYPLQLPEGYAYGIEFHITGRGRL